MKKLLCALLIVKIVATSFLVIYLLPSSIIISVVYGILSILEIALVIAVIINTDKIEDLLYNVSRVRADIKNIYDCIDPKDNNCVPSVDFRETARGAWDCVKCGTVNKKGSSVCVHCGAGYSSWNNPTVSESQKKKVSRWIK